LILIHREFGLAEQEQTQQILNLGKAFILLDGLDEVPSQLRQLVRDQIYEFTKEYRESHLVLTCRTQTIEYIADNFQPIEVADFDADQVNIFARKWFTTTPETSRQGEEWTSKFIEKLEENEQICELAVTPILLTLTCLLFIAEQDLPTKQSDLYDKGSNLLLKQWDRFREIPRDYQQLSVSDKQKLLSYLAFRKFEQPYNFILFEQNEIQRYIAEHLGIEAEESEAVLKTIEAHHGLLIERAKSIWSFSHLTFQEYFAGKHIVDNLTPEAAFQALVNHITEPRWREVFLLVVEMLTNADSFLQLMKQKVDLFIANDQKLQLFLFWIYGKSLPVNDDYYEPTAIRVYYLCLEYVYRLGLFDFDEVINLANRFGVDVQNIRSRIATLGFDSQLYQLLHFYGESVYFLPKDALAEDIEHIFKYFKLSPDLKEELQQLKDNLPEFPDPEQEKEKFQEVWAKVRPIWTEKLRAIMIKYCNIGYDWQFSEEQIELLRQYYDANEFLLECMDSAHVSQQVRQGIEETLLLPIAEIEKRSGL
jgi:predicted NACHT family NTPase